MKIKRYGLTDRKDKLQNCLTSKKLVARNVKKAKFLYKYRPLSLYHNVNVDSLNLLQILARKNFTDLFLEKKCSKTIKILFWCISFAFMDVVILDGYKKRVKMSTIKYFITIRLC